jgi:hypothetical protein
MTPKRTTGYVGLMFAAAAWLANAAGLSLTSSPPPQAPTERVDVSPTQLIANEVQAQASRLRERLTTVPVPRQPFRNPFAFAARTTRQDG